MPTVIFLPALAEELARLKADVIVTSNTAATIAVKHATTEIPIVCTSCTDPVGMGLAASEARPGGAVTGLLTRVDGLAGKLIELARDVMPKLKKIGLLTNIANPSNPVQRREVEAIATGLAVTIVP